MHFRGAFDDVVKPREAWGLIVCCFVALAFWVGVGMAIGYLIWG